MARKSESKTPIGTIITAILLITVIVFGIAYLAHDTSVSVDEEPTSSEETETEEVDDNADADKNTADTDANENDGTGSDSKDLYEQEVQKPNNTSTTMKTPTFRLSIADTDALIIVAASITNFKEEGGKCTIVLKNNSGTTRTFDTNIMPDPRYTVCESKQISKNDLGAGEWSIYIEYNSATAAGTSETQRITIK